MVVLLALANPVNAIKEKTIDGNYCIGGETATGVYVFGCKINGMGYAFDNNDCWRYDGVNSTVCTFQEFSVMVYYFNLRSSQIAGHTEKLNYY